MGHKLPKCTNIPNEGKYMEVKVNKGFNKVELNAITDSMIFMLDK